MNYLYSEKYLLFYALALISEILGTVSGFGSSILFVPIAAYFFDFHAVLAITALFHVFSNLSKIALFRYGIEWNMVRYLGISSVVSVVIGASLSKFVASKELELILSIFMIFIALLLIFKKLDQIKPSHSNLIVGGSLSGFVAGLMGTGGAIRGLTLSAFSLEKNSFIATSSLIDFGVDSTRLLVYLYNGFVQKEFLFLIPPLLFISVVGSYLGKVLLKHVTEYWFQKIVLSVIILVALIQIVKLI